jgi:hypothetical protein
VTWDDISGWAPDWRPADEQFERQRDRLLGLVGRRIEAAWIVWNEELDRWFPDLPVILSLDNGLNLEVCWQKFHDLSITWDTIDTAVTPRAWVEWPLQWRASGHDALTTNVAKEITSVLVTEFRFVTMDVDDYPHRDSSGAWVTGGLWLDTSGPGLHIFNALDENGLEAAHPGAGPDQRTRPISS